MTLKVPEANTATFRKVMDALGGEDYSYYSFDVKNIEDAESRKKVQILLKVYVPQAERNRATKRITDALESDGVDVLTGDNQIDAYIANTDNKKVIRLQIKPPSGGSGAGADVTKIVESAQCLYAAMIYECKDLRVVSEADLKCGQAFSDTPGVKLEQILSLDAEWKNSSMKGGALIKRTLGGSAGTYEFVRGDKVIDDGAIAKAFKRVKSQTNLASEDKWNPADIWAVRKSMKAQIAADLKAIGTIGELNSYLQAKNAAKDLVGFSLKKLGGSPSAKLLNAETPNQRKAALQASFHHYDLTFDNKRRGDKQYPMDVYYYYGSGNFQKFQARNFGGENKGDWKLELKGQFAAQGKIQGAVVAKVLTQAGFTGIPKEADWNKCRSNAPATVKKAINEEIYNLLKKYNAANLPTDKDSAMQIINMRPQAWKYSKLSGLRFLNYLKGLNGRADDAMKALYLYAGSQSDYSSVYYKLS